MTWYRPILSVIILLINKWDYGTPSLVPRVFDGGTLKGSEGLLLGWGEERPWQQVSIRTDDYRPNWPGLYSVLLPLLVY